MIIAIVIAAIIFTIIIAAAIIVIVKKFRKIEPGNELDELLPIMASGGQLIGVVGEPGDGKTFLITGIEKELYDRYNPLMHSYMLEQVNELRGLGYTNVREATCLFFNNYDVILDIEKQIKSCWARLNVLGFPEADMHTEFYPNGSSFFFTENEGDIDSRKFKEFNSDSQYSYLKARRHMRQNIVLDLHSISNIELRFRQQFNRIYRPYRIEINGEEIVNYFFNSKRKPVKKIVLYARKYDKKLGGDTLMEYGFNGSIPKEQHIAKLMKYVKFVWYKKDITKLYDDKILRFLNSRNTAFSAVKHLSTPTLYERDNYLSLYGYGKQSLNARENIKNQINKLI